ncbi:MAG: nucleotide exchange factor GrpE [Clostridiales bacterium]|nr:nucleotide exchange factor GrpE [Clostridiales bacterium]
MEEKKEKSVKEKVSAKEKALIEENENLIKEIDGLKAQADEFKDKWMRNVAEFDNYKKRNAKLWQDAFNEGVASVIIKILPVGDNLDWALTLGLDEKTAEGIKNVKRKFNDTLESLEIEEIDPLGQPFDPNVAEAVMQVPAEEGEQSDTVKQVFQKGYRKKDKIIRYATVSVVK